MEKTVRQRALTADDYKKMDQKEHIYKIPDTYIGSDSHEEREEWVFHFEKQKLLKKKITVPQAVERLFLEIISNAGDNVFSSRLAKVDPGVIDITLSDTYIRVRNGGNPIPIEVNKEFNMYAPELIFGELLSSSNYDTKVVRMGCGRNGFGAKLVNIFSKEFMIDIGDPIRGLRFQQRWSHNMSQKDKYKITSYKGPSYVEVTYTLDFERFQYTSYTPEVFALFGRLALEVSLTCKVPIKINERLYECQDIKSFASLLFPPTEEDDPVKRAIVYEYVKQDTVIEICALDTPDAAETLSYVNGMITRDGGVHVTSALKALTKNILTIFTNKGGKTDPKLAKASIKAADLTPHLSLLLICRIPDPKFTSQTKTKLSAPEVTIHIPDKVLTPMKKWRIVERMCQVLEMKQLNALKETDGKKKRFVTGLKGEEANYAGTSKSKECTLYIVEGKSAMGYAVKAISTIPNGRDYHGILPIKGKLLNVMKSTPEQILKNQEIYEIKQKLGLKEGLDYTQDENFKTLRYGYLVILTDADDDGKHITGLILNFFYCRFPSLLARGFVFTLLTPIIRVTQGSVTKNFYHGEEYEMWKRSTPNYLSWSHRYYKGLGTSTDKDIKDDFKDPKLSMFVYDEGASDFIRLAFDSGFANERKNWISQWTKLVARPLDDPKRKDIYYEYQKFFPVSQFMNTEFIKFSVSNVHRSIPRLLDGLKVAQRKILWTAFHHWKMTNSWSITKSPKELKVAQFATKAAEVTNYHHGELCLAQAIISMAQDFVGANNLPYFTRDGQFGCIAPDTPVQLYNGTTKVADQITPFDVLIGDDGEPRHISQVVSGTDWMYKVHQSNGTSYDVNSLHILTLWYPKYKSIITFCDGVYTLNAEVIDDEDDSPKSIHMMHSDEKYILQVQIEINMIDINIQKFMSQDISQQQLYCSVHRVNDQLVLGGPVNIEPLGYGPYVGWYLDGNERFLLGDGTVTHNTRNLGGSDASQPRYPFTRPEKWLNYVFKAEDFPLMTMTEDEGLTCEPLSFLPILPMGLVNGCLGVGTGHSTFIPNCSPLEVTRWLLHKLKGQSLQDVLPWYRGFQGDINVRTDIVPQDEITDETPEEEEEQPVTIGIPSTEKTLCMITTGKYKVNPKGAVVVSELPVGVWTNKYAGFLDSAREDKLVHNYRNLSSDSKPLFEIQLNKKPSLKTLKLVRTYGLTNMVLLDNLNVPHKYKSLDGVLQAFFDQRLPYYEKRKKYILNQLTTQIQMLEKKLLFISLIDQEKIVIYKKKKEEILAQMKQYDIPEELLSQIRLSSLSEEEMEDLENQIISLQEKKLIAESFSPEEMWVKDLEEFEKFYLSTYGDELQKETSCRFRNEKINYDDELPLVI